MKQNINIKNKFLIKVPTSIVTIYCNKTNVLIFKHKSVTKTLKLTVKIFQYNNCIILSKIPGNTISKSTKKNLEKLQGTIRSKIKLILIEILNTLYKKLNLIGVGYRVFTNENLTNQITLKLGFSHLIYHKIPENLNIFCLKGTKLFIFGTTSYDKLTQTIASIRQCKAPEPYKGKGILYYQESIRLKKGKKI